MVNPWSSCMDTSKHNTDQTDGDAMKFLDTSEHNMAQKGGNAMNTHWHKWAQHIIQTDGYIRNIPGHKWAQNSLERRWCHEPPWMQAYGITICLINALFTCVKGCSWYHYLWAMLWSLVSREVHDITISLSYSVLTCVQGHSLYHRMWSYALFACIQGGSWHHHLSRLFCAHLCPGMFLISPSVWIICCAHLCQWVFMALPPLWAMLLT
jgi:hypothetical protein